MSTNTVSSTQQQDQIARSNSAQIRRHGADQKASQGASSVFADLLQQATEPAEVDSADLLQDTSPQDSHPTPDDPSTWLALTQAYGTPRATNTPTANTSAPDTRPAAETLEAPTSPLAQTAPTDDEPVPELDAESRAEATSPNPRRTPAKAVAGAGAASPSTTGLGAPASSARHEMVTTTGPTATANTLVTTPPGAVAILAARVDTPARAVANGLTLLGSATENAPTPLPSGLERVQAARSDAGAPQTDVHAGGEGTSPSERGADAEAPQPDAVPWAEQWGEAMEDVGHQISYWLGKGVKQAQIQVDAGLDRPLEVAVSLDKGQAVLHFQTDSAQARAAIESGAADALRDALARDGIGLAGLSVGSQDRQGRSGAETLGSAPEARGIAQTADDSLVEAATITRPSNRVLDLYA